MSRRRRLVLAYLALVVASRLWIVFAPAERTPADGTRIATIAGDAGDAGEQGTTHPVRLAYHERGPRTADAVVLLHGSPGSLQDFDGLAEALGSGRRVVVPELLGFGDSTRDVPDHGFGAQADAVLQLLDALAIERAHVVGFSWGGGVAITLADRAPERVASLVLVSALGVQELELLGRHDLNHLVHRLLEAVVTTLDWTIPHFGAFDGGFGGRGFTRSFVDADQRPLRAALRRFEGPMLVLHGRRDLLVPPAAAREHHRLVPQSRLVWLDGGHLVLWQHPDTVVRTLVDWLDDASAGRLPTRTDATAARIASAALPFERALAGPQDGIGWAVFALLVFGASLVGEDLTCIGVGLLVAAGQVGLLGAVVACVFALVAGDLLLYAGGRWLGAPLLRRLGRDPRALVGLARRFEASTGVAVLAGRFVPGARLPTYVAAGLAHRPVLPFAAWLTVAALLWAPLLVGATAAGGRLLDLPRFAVGHGADRIRLGLAVAFVVAIATAARLGPAAATWRGRRLLRARWARLVHWEFWPSWAIYGPLVPVFAALALRHRSLRVATLVNPPIPGGGLAGESKAAIGALLERVPEHAVATGVVEPGAVETRLAAVRDFMAKRDLAFPIVLKPDVGERGRDVAIVADPAAVRCYFESRPARALVQPFVDGEEFGLFWVRLPGAAVGELFSIARKVPRSVVGNGRDPLEQLILADPICLPMAEKLLEANADRLDWIPGAGVPIRLTQLGTHSRGARFLVGEDLRTPVLEAAVARASEAAGLDFGRYDVRAASEAALRAGQFRILEFNGLTAEAAHLYDPRHRFGTALRILATQWRRAFAIGAAHRARGRRPLGWRALAALVRQARST